MTNYKDYIISKGGKELGLLFEDIEKYLLTPDQNEKFHKFMRGQTCGMVGGIPVCYTCDYLNFISGRGNDD